jgi:sugar/nucleoside kinase (ribokinase family)
MLKNVLTFGGATQDVYLRYKGADCMQITEGDSEKSFMLFESGSKIEVEKVLYYTGGGSTNSAVSFKRMGFNVSCFCKIGNDQAGRAIVDDLDREQVDHKSVIISADHPSGISFVINSTRGERTIFAFRGANGHISESDISTSLLNKLDLLYVTSLSHDSAQILEKIVRIAKEKGSLVAVNPGVSQLSGGAQELKKSLKYIDILILNSSEARTFMSALVSCDQRCASVYFSVPSFFKEVMKIGPKIVVVTDGSRGVYLCDGTRILFHPSLKSNVVDTLGAGDSFGSCFVGNLLSNVSIEDSLRRGLVNSTSVIEHFGAKPGLLNIAEIEKREKAIDKKLLQSYDL